MSALIKHAPVYAEPGFERSLGDLPHDEQRSCLVQIAWFDRECPQDQRGKSSWKVESASRRRIRAVRASKDTVVLYAVSNSGQNWVWAGWHSEAESAGSRIDARPIESPEPIDVDVMLANLKIVPRVEGPAPVDVDAWSNSVEEAALAIAESKSLCGRIRSRLADRLAIFDELSRAADVTRAENARLVDEATKMAAESEAKPMAAEPKPTGGDLESRLAAALERHSAACVEIEGLKKEVKALTKRVRTADAELSIRRGSGDKVSAAKERVEELEQELGALKAVNKKEAVAAMTDLIVDGIKDQCSKVLDDAANRLFATERPSDEIHAKDLGRLAMKIRALTVKLK